MNDRQQLILQWVNDKQRISVSELSEICQVSEVTIRHDLTQLEQRHYLRRAHGFAVAIQTDDVDTRMLSNFAQKQKLAKFAASLIRDGETVFFESGSSIALLAQYLSDKKNLTVITVSSYVASLLKSMPCEVVLLGGMYQKTSQTVVGPLTKMCLQQMNFSKAFMGVDGFTVSTGFTGRDMLRADIVNAVVAKGAENIVLTDSSKFGQINLNSLGPVSAFSRVITDEMLAEEYQRELSGSGIKVSLVG
ncbi:MAG: DNA-binding transcriptional regulator YciT [Rahnella inusitata]|jgi:DeoR/GlpR family transcriptional regulator of sugar metabolism|uniref:DeoR/GlpR family DNA-binding transcription regulator n=1 Tax=Rahnella inusitata TaxID=58169 RepID=UPI00185DAB91|nr:DNA-binding transcriptional regulator YciT [Rahnella inusitata]NMC26046.1 DeoR/GlpR transcriptional regulator [Serratia sp. (in: enterobacteria)]QUT13915.1 DeoR/GlpR transcriptional regulator [Rahnella inusitata]